MPCRITFDKSSVSFEGHAEGSAEACAAISALSGYFEILVEAQAEGYRIEAERRTPLKKITWIGHSPGVSAGEEALYRTMICLASQYPGMILAEMYGMKDSSGGE